MLNKLKVTGAATLLALSVGAQANVVDLFTDPIGGQKVETDGTTFSESGSFPATILGGYRDLSIVENSGGFPGTSASLNVNGGFLSASAESGVDATATVQWDGQDNSSTLDNNGLGGVDLVQQAGCPATGCDRFSYNIHNSDAGANPFWAFTIGLYTDDNNWTEFDLVATAVPLNLAGVPFSILFSDFTVDAGNNSCGQVGGFANSQVVSKRCGTSGTVDVTSLGAMQLAFNVTTALGDSTTDLDLTIGGITKVPEPGILALMGLGLAAGSLARRRKS